jgi:DNA-binding XRE family transcriptional regulator
MEQAAGQKERGMKRKPYVKPCGRTATEPDTTTRAGHLGAIIRTTRIAVGLSVMAAAAQAGLRPLDWHRWERGARMPRADLLVKIAAVLGTRVEKLFAA